MPKDDRGMRQFIAAVRDRAPDPESDAVLFLPNDPNIEAWLERPRPRLSSSIIFTDQYWDRYVDADLQRLHAAPPRVIVIGPRNYWRIFQRCWNVNKGCERLIDLVQARLLPGRYRLSASQSILYRGKRDYMDIYVLDQEPALGAAVARKSDSGPTQ